MGQPTWPWRCGLMACPVSKVEWDRVGNRRLGVVLIIRHILKWFYRAMHCSAKRGLTITCRLSVRPSVCDVGGS